MFADPLTEKLATFVRGIGIDVRAAALDGPTFFPGIDIQYGAILLDEARLKHPADILFHPEQHNGNSQMLIDNFTSGRYIGLPLLQWFGMTVEPRQAAEHGEKPFPHMLRWVR